MTTKDHFTGDRIVAVMDETITVRRDRKNVTVSRFHRIPDVRGGIVSVWDRVTGEYVGRDACTYAERQRGW